MADAYQAYLAERLTSLIRQQNEMLVEIETLETAHTVYEQYLASRETAAVARDTVPGDGGGTAVNALAAMPAVVANKSGDLERPAGIEPVVSSLEDYSSAIELRTPPTADSTTATPMPPGDRCEPRGEPHIRMSPLGPVLNTAPPDELEIPKFLDRRKGTGSAGAEHPSPVATDGAL